LFEAIIIPGCSKFLLLYLSSSLSRVVIAPPAALKIASGEAKSQSFGELCPGRLKEI